MRKKRIFVILLLLMSISCQKKDEDESSIIQINYGTSFGMCIGYCKKEVYIKSGNVTYKHSGWMDSIITKTCSDSLPQENWSSLLSGLDTKKFFDLPGTIGCPDCADGGAEYVEIETFSGDKHKVTFEYLKEPELLKNTITDLRKQAEKATACFEN